MSKSQSINQTTEQGLWNLMVPVRSKVNQGMFLSALGTCLSFSALIFLLLTINALHQQESPWVWIVLSAIGIICGYLCRTMAFTLSHYAAFRLENVLRSELCDHLTQVNLGFVTQMGSGALTRIIQDDVRNLHVFVADSTPLIGRAIVAPLISLVVLFFISWPLALVVLFILLSGFSILALALRGSGDVQNIYDQENERINQRVIEFVQAMPVIRTFDSGSDSFTRYQNSLKRFRDIFSQWLSRSSRSARASTLLLTPITTLVAICFSGLLLIPNNTIDLTQWVAFLILGCTLVETIVPLSWLNVFIRKASASAMRIEQLRQTEKMANIVHNDQAISLKIKTSGLKFDHVSFTYPDRTRAALTDISFHAMPGTVTALVGVSGCGKSTIARLVPRFWDIQSGKISINNSDIRDIEIEHLMQQISFVFQETFLFSGSILENIAQGSPNASHEDIINAAKAAQADHFIRQLPQGYQTRVGDRGSYLSGGQRQCITIARAILQDRPILILDEASAFIDPENEAELITSLAKFSRNKTVIIIAHRLNTIVDADQILVLQQGAIRERGKHLELLEQHGLYAHLWKTHQYAQDWKITNHA